MEEKEEVWIAPSLFSEEETIDVNKEEESESKDTEYVRDPNLPDYIIPYYEQINNIPPPEEHVEKKKVSGWYYVLLILGTVFMLIGNLFLGLLSLLGLYRMTSRH